MVIVGNAFDVLKDMESESIDCVVTSPPYWNLRDYKSEEQLGLEPDFMDYVKNIVNVFAEIHRVLKKTGTVWLNIGDTYSKVDDQDNNIKKKDLIGIPWRIAFALQDWGWYLRQDIIWEKPDALPESAKDRCGRCHEYIFLLTKSQKYYFDHIAIQVPAKYDGRNDEIMKGSSKYNKEKIMPTEKIQQLSFSSHKRWQKNEKGERVRNKRTVWTVPTSNYKGLHFATFPKRLIEPCILAGCPEGGIVLDPFGGAGTTAVVAVENNRKYIIIEVNPKTAKAAKQRIEGTTIKMKFT